MSGRHVTGTSSILLQERTRSYPVFVELPLPDNLWNSTHLPLEMLLLSPAEQQEHSLSFLNVLRPFDWPIPWWRVQQLSTRKKDCPLPCFDPSLFPPIYNSSCFLSYPVSHWHGQSLSFCWTFPSILWVTYPLNKISSESLTSSSGVSFWILKKSSLWLGFLSLITCVLLPTPVNLTATLSAPWIWLSWESPGTLWLSVPVLSSYSPWSVRSADGMDQPSYLSLCTLMFLASPESLYSLWPLFLILCLSDTGNCRQSSTTYSWISCIFLYFSIFIKDPGQSPWTTL